MEGAGKKRKYKEDDDLLEKIGLCFEFQTIFPQCRKERVEVS